MIPMANYVVPDSFLSNIEREKKEREIASVGSFCLDVRQLLPCHPHGGIFPKKKKEFKKPLLFEIPFFSFFFSRCEKLGGGKNACVKFVEICG